MKRKLILGLVLLALACSLAVAQEARITEIAGRVEYQLPGASWRPARVGDALPRGTVISTGFKSSAKLQVANAVITVNPVTRLTIEQLVQTSGSNQAQLFLLAGRVSAEVTPQANTTTEFRVSSPTATASVRGTGFQFDGVNLLVGHGAVELRTPLAQTRLVAAGEFTYVAETGQVATPAAVPQGAGFSNIGNLVLEVLNSDLSGSVDASVVAGLLTNFNFGGTIVPPEAPTGTLIIDIE
ncbi:MAG: hypothetical protein A2087_04920 [Spirochaetes bacterium GWD1_61_31]|nr:MAG: hypothetical protein A2Y37_01540 [Spirochaetes bacterium GWB1_60_80]OHD34898.1 MAG: hypothetical protein A2004_00570 [Spirochaetes bacterium GWC1_61_12]OHD37073.1 MAG: hypothetical protein A2087_04920 [Spirochaetes bacterium GWD1_61_31]OHD44662.1 MAG: hypothetical protein A2Y35_11880 [Spirochaetes bacterium GWE1_60_18]OHD61069.1 MAG: hypothetical protein A2Y32_09155 [Spirochaetes bacterium GWF1_60_12]HAP42729.1 hypothetical protein [Spirochaetaceae bacterium]